MWKQGTGAGAELEPMLQDEPSSGAAAQGARVGAELESMLQDEAEPDPVLQGEPSAGAAAQGAEAGAKPELVSQEEPSVGATTQGAGVEPECVLQDEAEAEPVLQDEPSLGVATQGAGVGAELELVLQEEPSLGANAQGAGTVAEPESVLQEEAAPKLVLLDKAKPEPVLQDELSPSAAAQGAGAGAELEPMLQDEPSSGAAAQGARVEAELESMLQDEAKPDPVLQGEPSASAAAQGAEAGAKPELVSQEEPSVGATTQGAGVEPECVLQDEAEAEPVLQDEPSPGVATQGAGVGAELELVLQEEPSLGANAQGAGAVAEPESVLQEEAAPKLVLLDKAKPEPVLQDELSPSAAAQGAGTEPKLILQDGATHEIEEAPSDVHISQTTIENLHPSAKSIWNKRAFFYTLIACMTSIMLAYEQAVINGAASYLQEDLRVSNVLFEVLMGVFNLFTFIGLVMATVISNRFGRRWTILAAGALYIVGPFFMGLAYNYPVFIVGHCFANLGAGYALMIAPIYVVEISPVFSRGFFTSFPRVFIDFGTILGNISIYYFSKLSLSLGWRLMLITGVIPSVVLALVFLVMPESPKWLIMQGRLRDAKGVLAKISNSEEEAALRLSDMKKAAGIAEECNEDVVQITNTSVYLDLLHPTCSICHMLVCAIGIQMVQQGCGMDTLLLYKARIFEKIYITTSHRKFLLTMGIDIVKTFFVLVAAFCLDRFGRRTLLLSSIGGMILSLVSFGSFLIVIEHSHTKLSGAAGMCISMLFVYVASFSIGIGPIADVYSSEIYPLWLRTQGHTIGVGVKHAVRILLSLTYLSLSKAITFGGTAILFAVITSIAWVVFYLFMPETKGLAAEEMEQLFGKLPIRRSTVRVVEMQRTSDTTEAVATQLRQQRGVNDENLAIV